MNVDARGAAIAVSRLGGATVTGTTSLTIALTTLGLRILSPLYFLPLVALLVLLLERELIRAFSGPGAGAAIRILGVATLPLLVAFAVLVALRLSYIFGAS